MEEVEHSVANEKKYAESRWIAGMDDEKHVK